MTSPTIETLQMQLQSSRKSLLFMETQHATTLKGLHTEIHNLQKKCSGVILCWPTKIMTCFLINCRRHFV